ncbi:MAG: DNA gyrase/topoisomerase IV subunit B [Candidatus Micrarchaeia archaeon]|jgi:DNA gyrase subunit B
MAENKEEYNASKIIVLEGVQGIRKRPAMYIGSTGSSGVLHLLFELIDNAVDEAMAGYCKNIIVRLTQDETGDIGEVIDDGRGIPVDIMPKYNKSALEVILTSLHSGAKFTNEVYKTAGGLHGVGLTVVNALSEFLEVRVRRDGKEYMQTYSRGMPTSELKEVGPSTGTGTAIKFKPDPEIFPSPRFDSMALKERLKYTSFLNPGIKLYFVDDRFGVHEESLYHSEKGLVDFLAELNKGMTTITSPIYLKKDVDRNVFEFGVQYNSGYDEKLESFVNNIRTEEGGTHVMGFRAALTRAITNYIEKNKMLNGRKDVKINGDDVREGLTAIVSVLIPNPEFEGQTKEKLGNTKIKSLAETTFYQLFSQYLEEHPIDARAIAEKAINAAVARESARKARELVRKKSIFDNVVLPGKLADCIEADPNKIELFIVEGESAGGSSKQGRDKMTQAILPLRGKILNVEKATDEKIFENAELRTIVAALGTGIKETFNVENIRYKKIIIMTDADVDGSHIRTLLLTFFYRYLRKIIELGYVYIAQPPLYKVSKGKEVYYCYSDAELEEKMKALGKDVGVQRYKGLGEMNPEQLWETTMNPEKRILKKVYIADAERADRLFSVLMGLNVSERRKFLEEHSTEVALLDI